MDEPTREEIGDLLRRLVDTVVEMKDRVEELEAQLATTPSPEAVARAALEFAANEVDCGGCYGTCMDPSNCNAEDARIIRAAASDSNTIAAIIKTAGGKKDE